jgi:hypothetical protein
MKYYNTFIWLERVRGRSLSVGSHLMAIGDPGVFGKATANALKALRDVQEACFLPLASC